MAAAAVRSAAPAGRCRLPAARLCSKRACALSTPLALPALRAAGPRTSQRTRASEAQSVEGQVSGEERQEIAPVFDADDKINDWQLLRIVTQDIPDEEVNEIVWECLGYVKSVEMDPETLTVETKWDATNVFPKWRARYPTPPDVLGVTRKYYPEVDAPVKEANAALARSIPQEYKRGLKDALRPLGWTGFKLEGLTPNKTRRAQVANWLVFYRSELRGVSLEELQRRKAEKQAKEEAMQVDRPTGTTKQGVV